MGGHEISGQGNYETTMPATVTAVVEWCRANSVWISTISQAAQQVRAMQQADQARGPSDPLGAAADGSVGLAQGHGRPRGPGPAGGRLLVDLGGNHRWSGGRVRSSEPARPGQAAALPPGRLGGGSAVLATPHRRPRLRHRSRYQLGPGIGQPRGAGSDHRPEPGDGVRSCHPTGPHRRLDHVDHRQRWLLSGPVDHRVGLAWSAAGRAGLRLRERDGQRRRAVRRLPRRRLPVLRRRRRRRQRGCGHPDGFGRPGRQLAFRQAHRGRGGGLRHRRRARVPLHGGVGQPVRRRLRRHRLPGVRRAQRRRLRLRPRLLRRR